MMICNIEIADDMPFIETDMYTYWLCFRKPLYSCVYLAGLTLLDGLTKADPIHPLEIPYLQQQHYFATGEVMVMCQRELVILKNGSWKIYRGEL